MNPLKGVALLFDIEDSRSPVFLGSCFSYCHRTHFLTAHHCVGSRRTKDLRVVSPADNVLRDVGELYSHPTCDLSLLVTMFRKDDPVEPFWGCVGNYSLGEDFYAFGFPEDSVGPNQGHPTARLFKGSFQRFFQHRSHMGYKYLAGELSIPCPGGLSGGPLFRPGAPPMLTGFVTENIEATTLLDSQEIIEKSGAVTKEHYRRVINYGIAVMLNSVNDWLVTHIPPRDRI